MKVKPTDDVVENEKALLAKTFADAWEKLSTEEREAFLQEAGCKSGSLSAATPVAVILVQLGTKLARPSPTGWDSSQPMRRPSSCSAAGWPRPPT